MSKPIKPRRMAIKAEWQRDSNSAPGFNKYFITIRETDGTELRMPAYGRDMQDALSRLVKTERAEKAGRGHGEGSRLRVRPACSWAPWVWALPSARPATTPCILR